jgi:hypothetical protein
MQTSKHGVETHVIGKNDETQTCASCQQSDVDEVLGLEHSQRA